MMSNSDIDIRHNELEETGTCYRYLFSGTFIYSLGSRWEA
jgi:hypothetical protein